MMKKLFESWRKYLEEEQLEEVSVKHLKQKNPEMVDVIDEFARELENKSLLGAVKMYQDITKKIDKKRLSDTFDDDEAKRLIDLASTKALTSIVEEVKKFEQLVKSKKLDAWLKYQNNKFDTDDIGPQYKDLLKFYGSFGKSKIENFKRYVDNISQFKTKKEKERETKKQIEKIYQDEKTLILQPKSMEASCYYGYGTKWCISGKQDNMFDSYIEGGMKFIFIIDKDYPVESVYHKVAISYKPGVPSSIEMWDAEDEKIPAEVNTLHDIYIYPRSKRIHEILSKYMGIESFPEIKFIENDIVELTGDFIWSVIEGGGFTLSDSYDEEIHTSEWMEDYMRDVEGEIRSVGDDGIEINWWFPDEDLEDMMYQAGLKDEMSEEDADGIIQRKG